MFQSLGSFIQNQWDYFKAKILGLRFLYWSDRTAYARDLATLLGAYLSSVDTDQTVREKVESAIYVHQNLPRFDNVWKPLVDAIFGGDSQIYKGNFFSVGFTIGVSVIGSFHARIGPANLLIPWEPGYVLIDIGTGAAPTTLQMNQAVQVFRELKPDYYLVYFGYETTIGLDTALKLSLDLQTGLPPV